MTARPCHRCGEPIPARSYCPPCNPDDKTDRPRHEVHRNSTRWKKLSRRLRTMQPFCTTCGATRDLTVDHRKPIATHPELAYDLANLDVLCRPCNSAKDANLGRRGKTAGQPPEGKARSALHFGLSTEKDGGGSGEGRSEGRGL